MLWVLLQSESPWQRNDAITLFIFVFLCTRSFFFLRNRLREFVPAIIASIMATFEQILWERFRNILKRSFKHHKKQWNSILSTQLANFFKKISFGNAASSHSALIPLKTVYKKRGELLCVASYKMSRDVDRLGSHYYLWHKPVISIFRMFLPKVIESSFWYKFVSFS